MVKLLAVLLAILLTTAAADEGFFSSPGVPQGQHQQQQYAQYEQYDGYGNYYEPEPQETSFWDIIFGSQRRQYVDGALGGIGSVIIVVVFFAVGLVLLAASAYVSTSSGRGLDTDEWEVDHSVWMDQLQRDFEDSWSVE